MSRSTGSSSSPVALSQSPRAIESHVPPPELTSEALVAHQRFKERQARRDEEDVKREEDSEPDHGVA